MSFYCGYRQQNTTSQITGFEAVITTCAVQLPPGKDEAFSRALAGVDNGDPLNPKWAQMGYVTFRSGGSTNQRSQIFVEVQAGPDDDKDYFRAYLGTPDGGNQEYKAALDPATGAWTFYYNGNQIVSFKHANWVNATTLKADFIGEVSSADVPFVGTFNVPCNFGACALLVGQVFQVVNFQSGFNQLAQGGTVVASNINNAFAIYNGTKRGSGASDGGQGTDYQAEPQTDASQSALNPMPR
jgi:hypothetical protein